MPKPLSAIPSTTQFSERALESEAWSGGLAALRVEIVRRPPPGIRVAGVDGEIGDYLVQVRGIGENPGLPRFHDES